MHQQSAPPYAQRLVPPPQQRSAPPQQRFAPPQQRSAGPYPEHRTTTTGGHERVSRPYQPATFFDATAPADAPPASSSRPPGYADGKPRPNGAAVAALVFGIFGGSVLAIVLGFIGRARANAVGRGRAMATTGLILGVIWLAVEAGAIAEATHPWLPSTDKHPTTSTATVTDPGCALVEGSGAAATMEADAKAGNVTKLVTDFHTMSSEMTAAQAKTTRPAAAAAMKQFAADLTTYAGSLSKGQAFTQAEIDKFVADAGAVDRACSP
ncbi:MAG TPA: DUF4190 domain-containing protein [Micromonosporaceae bacterium]|nr:DUF4190 domain-containing protein [Micromonosporaceae bacterium]